jgi:hypothetical protein
MYGRFNVCIPGQVDGQQKQKVVMRIPMLHKLAEHTYPGTVDEKMRCEIGATAYCQDNQLPIAHVFGSGFPNGRTVQAILSSYGIQVAKTVT